MAQAEVEGRSRAEDLVEGSSEAAFVIDGGQRVLAWNAQAEDLLGVPVAQAVGKRCYELLSGYTAEGRPLCGPDCPAMLCFRNGQPFRATAFVVLGPRNVRRPLLKSSSVLPGPLERGVPKAVIFLTPREEDPESRLGTSSPLTVHTLGSLRLQQGTGTLRWEQWPRRRGAALFKMLLTRRGNAVHRETLLEALWPEMPLEHGLQSLKVLVHALRRYLEPNLDPRKPSRFIATEGECYRLLLGPHLWVDVDQFEGQIQEGHRALDEGRTAQALHSYQAAAYLYRGDYLEEDPYADWVALERERLRELYLSLLVGMASLYASTQNYSQAIATCRQALGVDSCRESVHRALMGYLWAAGQRTEALRQYQSCSAILQRELGVAPLPKTIQLYQAILQG
ncbi:MAG: winged helix-turn-helix domain-containing protein [Chloroflexi bacterium]|nr:winged helix-turn-helix domain-containing protein [Chloroflexota bacterium]